MRDRRSRGLMRLFRRSARTIRSAVTRLGVRAFKAARRSRRATVVACQRPPRAGAPSRFSVAAMFLMVSRRARSSLMRSTSACSFASRTSLPSAPTTFPNGILPDALRARASRRARPSCAPGSARARTPRTPRRCCAAERARDRRRCRTVAGAVRRQHLPANALDEPLDHAGDDDIARERRATPRPTTPAPMTATSASSVVRKPVLQ